MRTGTYLRAAAASGVLLAAGVAGVGSASAYTIHPSGRRADVTVAKGCPSTVAGDVTVANPGGGSATSLVRRDPDAGLLCEYGGQSQKLTRSVKLGSGGARQLARVADRLNLAQPTGTFHCPAALDEAAVVAFAYPGGGHRALWWEDSGCEILDNGRIAAAQAGHPGFNTFVTDADRMVRRAG